MRIHRLLPPASLTIAAAAVLTACGDAVSPTAPRTSSDASNPALISSTVSTLGGTLAGATSGVVVSSGTSGSGSSGSTIVSSGTSGSGTSGSGTSSSTVRVTAYPSSSITMTIGDHRLKLPAGTICDPAVSSYGAAEWDKPCTRISGPVQITATYTRNSDGRPRVDFSPALRFQPNGSGQVVTLSLLDRTAASTGGFTVVYCPTDGTVCVDESLTDSSVATRTDSATGYLYRRLKHFSGYTIAIGRSGDSEY
jgi:hypothetical protein